jgi:hypothetical protein
MISDLEAYRILSRNPEILSAEVGGTLALMSVRNGQYYALNGTASEIWRMLEQPVALARLSASVASAYEGDSGQIEKDLRETLEEWLAHRLIVATPRNAE